jgi:hypothetical protein
MLKIMKINQMITLMYTIKYILRNLKDASIASKEDIYKYNYYLKLKETLTNIYNSKMSDYQGLFMAYRIEYKAIESLRNQLNTLYHEKNLSWGQRVDLAKELLKKYLPIRSEINPSLIFKIPPNEKVDAMPIDSKYSKIFQKPTALSNVETTHVTLARGIIVGGHEVMQGYLNDQEGCPKLQNVLMLEYKALMANADQIF